MTSDTTLLRQKVNERLAAAAEEIFGLVERTIKEYQEEIYRSRVEITALKRQLGLKSEEDVGRTDVHGGNNTHNPVQVKTEKDVDAGTFEDYQIPITESDLTSQTFSADTKTVEDHEETSESSSSGSSSSDPSYSIFPPRKKRKPQKGQTCQICFKRCWSDSGLKKHVEVHLKDKSFKCTKCEKEFEDYQELVQHMGVHKGERPVSCKICGQQFSKNSLRANHMKEHNGQMHSCKKCGKCFVTSYHLRSCKGKKEGVRQKPFCCMTCGRKFYTDSDFKLHMEIHESWKRHLNKKQEENQAKDTETVKNPM